MRLSTLDRVSGRPACGQASAGQAARVGALVALPGRTGRLPGSACQTAEAANDMDAAIHRSSGDKSRGL